MSIFERPSADEVIAFALENDIRNDDPYLNAWANGHKPRVWIEAYAEVVRSLTPAQKECARAGHQWKHFTSDVRPGVVAQQCQRCGATG